MNLGVFFYTKYAPLMYKLESDDTFSYFEKVPFSVCMIWKKKVGEKSNKVHVTKQQKLPEEHPNQNNTTLGEKEKQVDL